MSNETEEQASTEEELFDLASIERQVGFALRSVKRHMRLFVLVFGTIVAITFALVVNLPRTYRVQTKILALRNPVLATLGNPRRAVPLEADAPTRAAAETVLRRENLVSLVKQTALVDAWKSKRGVLQRLKDRLAVLIEGEPSEQDILEGLVQTLEKRIKVTTEEGVVTIVLEWTDARMAYRLIEMAQQNFLEARHVTEISSIEDAISILEAHGENIEGSIQRVLQEIAKFQERASSSAHTTAPTAPKPQVDSSSLLPADTTQEQGMAQLRFMLRAKQRAILDLEEFRKKRLTELQAQLAEQKVVYSEQHPVIRDTMLRIESLREDSPQIDALRADEQELLTEYRRRGGRDPDANESTPRRTQPAPARTASTGTAEDPQLVYARQQLRIATETYQDILLRIDAARIELDTARAAFKYRYSVINPARLPKSADKPNVPALVIGGLLMALLSGVAATLLADKRRGRFLEAWQISETLHIPLLGEVKRS